MYMFFELTINSTSNHNFATTLKSTAVSYLVLFANRLRCVSYARTLSYVFYGLGSLACVPCIFHGAFATKRWPLQPL